MVSILSTIHIAKAKDSEGIDIPVIQDVVTGLVRLGIHLQIFGHD
jgi:hypothetical protein